jgi:methylated-DNA-protein-cysteine methyltransferase-like protein
MQAEFPRRGAGPERRSEKAGRDPAVHERIFHLVRQVPRGKVVSYGRIARIVGAGTPRVVGFAMRAAPDDVPWQRVVNAKGEVSPRSAGDGAAVQRRLLEAEGVRFDERGRIDLERFGWLPEE